MRTCLLATVAVAAVLGAAQFAVCLPPSTWGLTAEDAQQVWGAQAMCYMELEQDCPQSSHPAGDCWDTSCNYDGSGDSNDPANYDCPLPPTQKYVYEHRPDYTNCPPGMGKRERDFETYYCNKYEHCGGCHFLQGLGMVCKYTVHDEGTLYTDCTVYGQDCS